MPKFRRPLAASALLVAVVALTGCEPVDPGVAAPTVTEATPAASVEPSEPVATEEPGATPEAAGWVVTNVVDGDTLDVERDGITERIRVRGIDTPERGDCNYEEATNAMAFTAGGKAVTLVGEERDRYDRLVAYVDVEGGPDAGLTLIEEGLAIARYDSRDGYGEHPREGAYVAADRAAPVAGECLDPSPPIPSPAASGVVYANCAAVREAGAAPIRVGDPGYSRALDRDGDGVGCT